MQHITKDDKAMILMLYISKVRIANQSGFTLIEMMIVIAIIGILASIATVSYQNYIRKTQVMIIYQEVNSFRMPYQMLVNEGAGVRSFDPGGLNMPLETENCKLSVTAPNINANTSNAVLCQIQNLSYLSNQTISLDRSASGSWTCKASLSISRSYLPVDCQ
ncbi:pilin [uncultured Psychrobacter sp.]|uniref:pilin n=1 Tax=uncultured Psychrobacter sp. TaxID=259303 RepID=UPI00262F8881|nr:pilin [uncultured Psychrobacter sp.]